MPVLRYFVIAGAGLLALLFAVSAWLPAPVVTQRDANGLDKTTIRINGEKPAAERVTIDTSVPTITPPVAASTVAQSEPQDDTRRDALASMDGAAPVAALQPAPAPVKKVAVRKHPKRPVVVMARRTGLFDLW